MTDGVAPVSATHGFIEGRFGLVGEMFGLAPLSGEPFELAQVSSAVRDRLKAGRDDNPRSSDVARLSHRSKCLTPETAMSTLVMLCAS
jgi:hypothetical protein